MRLHNSHSPTHVPPGRVVYWISYLSLHLYFHNSPTLQRWSCHFSFYECISSSANQKPEESATKLSAKRKKTPLTIRPQAITCMYCTFFCADRWTHGTSSPTKHLPDCMRLCFQPSWHQVGICRFFNICSISQISRTGPSGAYANDCATTEPNMRF